MAPGLGGIIGDGMDNQFVMEDKYVRFSHKIYDLNTVTLMTISETFKVPRMIDYLSLDVEGGEFPALEHFNFAHYTIKVITIERPKVELHNLLSSMGYFFVRGWEYGESGYVHKDFLTQPIWEKYGSKFVPYWQPGMTDDE